MCNLWSVAVAVLSNHKGVFCCSKKNQNAPRSSEHPPVRGEKLSKRLGGIMGCKYKTFLHGEVRGPCLVFAWFRLVTSCYCSFHIFFRHFSFPVCFLLPDTCTKNKTRQDLRSVTKFQLKKTVLAHAICGALRKNLETSILREKQP